MEKIITIVITAVIVGALAFPFAFITQWAWDGSVAEIFHLPEITYWQAFWLNILGGMLCKGSG